MSFLDLFKRKMPAPPQYSCPNCHGMLFYKGPCGGASINVKCANPTCGCKYNACPPFDLEQIYNDDVYYYGGRAVTLKSLFGII
jgi:hypothetical protein